MKRNIFKSVFIVFLIVVFAGCNSSSGSSNSDELKQLQEEVSSLKSKNEELEKELSSLKGTQADKTEEQKSEQNEELAEDDQNEMVTVVVNGLQKIEKNIDQRIFSDGVFFEFSVSNNTDKDIQGVQGVLSIMDMFEEEFLQMNCDFTSSVIPAHETVILDELGIELNQFMDNHNKLFTTEHENLRYKYTIKKVLFTDGTSEL